MDHQNLFKIDNINEDKTLTRSIWKYIFKDRFWSASLILSMFLNSYFLAYDCIDSFTISNVSYFIFFFGLMFFTFHYVFSKAVHQKEIDIHKFYNDQFKKMLNRLELDNMHKTMELELEKLTLKENLAKANNKTKKDTIKTTPNLH